VRVASEVSDDLEDILRVDDHNHCGHHKGRCSEGAPRYIGPDASLPAMTPLQC
jgi:hypothetical protein